MIQMLFIILNNIKKYYGYIRGYYWNDLILRNDLKLEIIFNKCIIVHMEVMVVIVDMVVLVVMEVTDLTEEAGLIHIIQHHWIDKIKI